jgi:predicted metal-dependent hydrolase
MRGSRLAKLAEQAQQQLSLPWWSEEPEVSLSPAAEAQPPVTMAPAVRPMAPTVPMAPMAPLPPVPVPAAPDARRAGAATAPTELFPPISVGPQPGLVGAAGVRRTGAAPTMEGLPVFRHPNAKHEMRLGDALVGFELKRAKRTSIGMVVGPEGLSVRAPRWVGWGEIEQALKAKSKWICTKLADQAARERQQQASRIEWREGAEVPFMGEPVILVLDDRESGVCLRDDAQALPGVSRKTLHLGLPQHATSEQIRDMVSSWLQRQARQYFDGRVQFFSAQLGVNVGKVRLSSARTRWGSASADGSIRLHWRLIHFSQTIIDYVVAHELAHLREMNHSPRFWDVVASVVPEYDSVREQLRHVTIPE